jgi:hypothetical protein
VCIDRRFATLFKTMQFPARRVVALLLGPIEDE